MELNELPGIGAKRLSALQKAGILSTRDLLNYLPYAYKDTTESAAFCELEPSQDACVEGVITHVGKVSSFSGKTQVRATLKELSGDRKLELVYINQPWIAKQLTIGERLLLYGRISVRQGKLCMYCPEHVRTRGLIPKYRRIPGIQSQVLLNIIQVSLKELDSCFPENLPEKLRMRWQLCERNFALRQIHFPDSRSSLQIAIRRVTFEQTLLFQAAAAVFRGSNGKGIRIDCRPEWREEYWDTLSFKATDAQKRVLCEISADLRTEKPMARLVQGDVGCGKTAVAFGAIVLAAKAGWQSVLMAPTEILAQQHYETAKTVLTAMGIECGLLTGNMKASEKRTALSKIASGEWKAVIGTHALLSSAVRYAGLGLIITDEQHRFGVRQRKALEDKAELQPNVLVMSATPIPRTMSMVLYGDLDISVIDEIPAGRQPVITRIVPEQKREDMYRFLIREVKNGKQAYIVCPLVEENENQECKSAQEEYAALAMGALKTIRLGLVWGSQNDDEKQTAITKFKDGETDVLIATTVIEVGVNVPNATIMIVENADRFGLAQLHQLRGRVGRGSLQSWCFLMAEPNERLREMIKTNDGFRIAQADLEQRGPGELLGTRQHGRSPLPALALSNDGKLLAETASCLKEIMHSEDRGEWIAIQKAVREVYSEILRTTAMN